jgi:ATP-binding cassette subfamily B protein
MRGFHWRHMRDTRPLADKSLWEMLRSGGRLLTYLRPWWYIMVAVLTLMSLSTALTLLRPWIFHVFIDDVWPKGDYRLFGLVVGIFAVSMILGAVASFLQNYLTQLLGQRIVRSLRNQLYTHLQELSIRFFEVHPTGETMSRVVNDSEAVEFMLVGSVASIIMSVLTIGGVTFLLFTMNARLAALTLIPIPPVAIAVTFFGRHLHQRFSTFREKLADLNTFVQERLSGVRVVKSFAREAQEVEGFQNRTQDYYDAFMDAALRTSVFEPMMGLLMGLGTLIVLFFGGRLVLANGLKPGEFMAFVMYVATFYRPIERLGRQIGSSLPRSLASADRIFEFLDEVPELEVADDPVVPQRLQGRIELQQVSFGYEDELVLDDIRLTIEAGETVALVGPSGVGKTTMVDLIARFYDVQKGRILIDGIDVRQYEPRALRDQIGMVLQEPFLFNTTIHENIAYGRPNCHEDDVRRAAEQAGAAEFISQLPDGFKTIVGERGVKLSVGQKQRISIARALLKDPSILVLDEATSSVDTVTERVIQDALATAARGRTTILIAHRLSTTDIADRIVVLDGGRLVEEGTQAELLALGGRFAELWEMQSLDASTDGRVGPSPEAD